MSSTKSAESLALRLEKVVKATPERAFRAWTTPELLRQWSAPERMTIEGGDVDLRVGGKWSVTMVEPNGLKRRAFGVYKEIAPPKRLVYTHAWRETEAGKGNSPETMVTVEFLPEGDRTRVVLTQVGFESAPAREGHKGGWSESMDRLAKLAEEGKLS